MYIILRSTVTQLIPLQKMNRGRYIQAGRPKKMFLFVHLFLNINITNVFCAKKRVGDACICPRMVSG